MGVMHRYYTEKPGITDDYYQVRDFLLQLKDAEFTYARWDWMITHSLLDKEAIRRIGIWEDDGRVVGIAVFDTKIGPAYCLTLPEYIGLKKSMILYAAENLSAAGQCGIMIPNQDVQYQNVAAELGFHASESGESDAVFDPLQTPLDYVLPTGFRIVSMKDHYDRYQYRLVLWKGFNHELKGEGALVYEKADEDDVDTEMLRPNVDLGLKVAVVSPGGDFVSYCGMWYDSRADFAVVEPVATIPEYRRRGFGRAVVYEGIKRVAQLGAKRILVGSSQPFYYSIGFRPYAEATEWTIQK